MQHINCLSIVYHHALCQTKNGDIITELIKNYEILSEKKGSIRMDLRQYGEITIVCF